MPQSLSRRHAAAPGDKFVRRSRDVIQLRLRGAAAIILADSIKRATSFVIRVIHRLANGIRKRHQQIATIERQLSISQAPPRISPTTDPPVSSRTTALQPRIAIGACCPAYYCMLRAVTYRRTRDTELFVPKKNVA